MMVLKRPTLVLILHAALFYLRLMAVPLNNQRFVFNDSYQVAGPNINNNVPASEIDALHAIFNSTDGLNWNWRNASQGMVWAFNTSANPCKDKWQGIVCSSLPPLNVVKLTLFDFNLQGTLPNALGNLTKLTFLRIAESKGLVGTLPYSLGKLSRLDSLDISANGITGTIPPSLIYMQDLRSLMLYDNLLDGHIPEAFGSLTKLTGLNLAFNSLNGSFPMCLCNTTKVLALALNNNLLTGTIPNCLANLIEMLAMDISHNRFSGTLPSALGSMVQLRQLSIYSNRLSGTLPAALANLTHLSGLYANTNALTGMIPAFLEQLLTLTHLDLGENLLSGTFPQLLTCLTSLEEISLSENDLSGPLPDSIVQLNNLKYLEIDGCFLTGSLPAALGNVSQLLYILLYNNFMTGQIPASFQDLTKLQSFEISQNLLTGSIPAQLDQLTRIRYLWLNDNLLVGSIPRSLSAMTSLQVLFLSNNQLVGNLNGVFDPIAQLMLDTIQLSGNQLTGPLPQEIYALPSLETFAAVSNCIVTVLAAEVCSCTTLGYLALDGLQSSRKCQQKILPGLSSSYLVPHQLKGGIPACIFSMPKLNTLHLSGNGIAGSLPGDLVLSPSLIDLSLSHNSLTGTIPVQVQERRWYNLDLSYNRFTGILSHNFAAQTLNYSRYAQFDEIDHPAASVALALENNRLSGRIPRAIVGLLNVSVLGSNMFSCDLASSDLPRHDTGIEKYTCGSDGFNSPYYTWLAVLLIGAAAAYAVTVRGRYTRWKLWFEQARQWVAVMDDHAKFAYISAQAPSLANVMFVFDAACKLTSATVAYVLLVLLPFYVAISYLYGTFTYKYAWTVSAAFLSGVVATGLEMGLLLLLVALLILLMYNLCASYQNESRARAGRWSLRFLTSKTVAERRSLARRIGAYALFMFCSVAVVLGVNIAYIYVTLYSSRRILLFSQIFLSFFKLLWNNSCARHLMHWTVRIVFHSTDDSNEATLGSELMFVLLLVSLVNNIVIPCLVVAVISPSCFYNMFVRAPAVETIYEYQYCVEINTYNGECFRSKYSYGQTKYDPPFSYNYQCSSTFITYYAPAFVFLCITATILVPLSDWLVLWVHNLLPAESSTARFLLRITPRILRPIPDSDTPPPSQNALQPFFDANHRTVTLLSYFGILTTFGTVFPPLGVAVAITLLVSALMEKLKLGRFLTLARERGNFTCLDRIEAECRGAGGPEMLQMSVHLIITVSCWFYTLFLFDTLGDKQGFYRAYWVLIVMPLAPFVLYTVTAALRPTNQRFFTAEQQNGSSTELVVTISPMVAVENAML